MYTENLLIFCVFFYLYLCYLFCGYLNIPKHIQVPNYFSLPCWRLPAQGRDILERRKEKVGKIDKERESEKKHERERERERHIIEFPICQVLYQKPSTIYYSKPLQPPTEIYKERENRRVDKKRWRKKTR